MKSGRGGVNISCSDCSWEGLLCEDWAVCECFGTSGGVHGSTRCSLRRGLKPGLINKMVITRPRLNQLMEGGIRSTLYKGLVGDPLDISLLQNGIGTKTLTLQRNL
ncbi:uncharacterized protein LOC144459283 isoform X2 [Epinephelus lanceolatus]